MTKKDFFILIIKLFGLYWLVSTFFYQIPLTFSYITTDFAFPFLAYTLVLYAIIIAIFIYLIFKSDQIVRALRLERGFDEERIEFGQLSTLEIAKIGIFIIGGILFINNAGYVIDDTIHAFYWSLNGFEPEEDRNINWLVSALNMLIGFLLITNYSFIAKLLVRKDKEL